MMLIDVNKSHLYSISCLFKRLVSMRKQQKLLSPEADPENSEKGDQDSYPHASYIDIFYLSEKSIKITQNFKEKGVAAAPSAHP